MVVLKILKVKSLFYTSIKSCISSVQLLSRVWILVSPWTAIHQTWLFITKSWGLPKLMSIESVMPFNQIILCHPILLLPSIFPNIRVFPVSQFFPSGGKYWSFSFSISPSNEYSGLNIRMDWLDLFDVQVTLKSLLQHHSSKASILWCSAFLVVQLSHPYMTTGKTIDVTRQPLLAK